MSRSNVSTSLLQHGVKFGIEKVTVNKRYAARNLKCGYNIRSDTEACSKSSIGCNVDSDDSVPHSSFGMGGWAGQNLLSQASG